MHLCFQQGIGSRGLYGLLLLLRYLYNFLEKGNRGRKTGTKTDIMESEER